MTWRTFALAAAAALASWAGPARACTIGENQFLPSNYELVQLADAIAIATAEPHPTPEPPAGFAVTFRVDSALKGSPPERLQIIPAQFSSGRFGPVRPSDLDDISRPHRESAEGPCNRITFVPGQRYLIFWERTANGDWRQLQHIFSRVNEDYRGEADNWIRSVRRYIQLQRTLGPMEQIAALRRLADGGRDPAGATLSPAERADAATHLSSISPWKPTRHLLDLYARAERGEAAASWSHSGEAAPARAVRALSQGRHPGAAPLIERLWSAPASARRLRGPLLLYLARNGQYRRAYGWIETRLLAELAALPREQAIALLDDVAAVQGDDGREAEPKRWRGDRHAAATWPGLAVALYSYQVAAFGEEWSRAFPEGFRAARPADYRARPDIARALARIWDQDVWRWAIAELARPPGLPEPAGVRPPRDWEHAHALPLSLLVSSWDREHQPVLASAFCAGGERRRLVIHALGAWGSGLHRDLLARMAATPGLGEEERSWLVRAAVDVAARFNRDPWRTSHGRQEEENWLLSKLVRGAPMGAEPIACAPENGQGGRE